MKPKNYASAGVDVSRVKKIQNEVNALIASTHGSDVLPVRGHYAGLLHFGNKILAIHTDGVGSKVLVAQALGKYDTVGIDCVAMNVNDIICVGARPLALVDYLALEREDEELVRELMKGLVKGAKEAGVSIVGGETAIMPDVIKGIEGKTGFDLAATCVGETTERALVTGERMREGDVVIGLASTGIHSNGLTLARKILNLKDWGNELLTPTRIYVKPLLAMLRAVEVTGIAHITGGAFSKLRRIGARARRGFLLDNMPEPQEIFTEMKKTVRDEREMYRTFNMGIGMCIAVRKDDEGKALALCKKNRQEARVIGKITKEEGVRIRLGARRITF
ncbi:MAG: phosphoribosylformylglycinamidine cyclo-ligase [Candidatus Micrarchaeota archaeon]